MGKNSTLEESEVDQEPEASSDTDQSYEEMFNDLWGADESNEPESDEPSSDEEQDEEQEVEESAEGSGAGQGSSQETPPPAPPTSTPASSDPYAWIDSLPEEVKEQARALRNQASSHQGRATAFQRRVSELQEDLRRLEAARKVEPADRKPQATESAAQVAHSKKLEALKEDFPEFAEALEEVRSAERQEVERRLQEALKPLEEDRARKRVTEFEQAVTAEAERIFNTPETGVHWKDIVAGADFRAWLDMQPKSVQQAARTPDVSEAVFVLRRYEDDYQRAVKELGLDKSSKETAAPVSNEAARAEELKRKRKQRQVTSTAPGSRPADGGKHDVSGDYEEMFDAMWGR